MSMEKDRENAVTGPGKGTQKLFGVIASLMLIVIFLISSFEIGAYSDYGFYEKEYKKYGVADELYMEMPDIMEVTRYMMSYLRGGEETLSIETMVEGNHQDFFNEQDRFHMGEVRDLFIGGLRLRWIAVAVLVIVIALFIRLHGDWRRILPVMYQRTLAVFLGITAVLGVLMWQNFNRCFVIFHKIFFDNDLWIFDPETDYMIRMLPEGFFYDMAVRIGVIFIAFLLISLAASVIWRAYVSKKTKKWRKSNRNGMYL
ncbi:TIGR01906 family membrane protein [Roseburia hominis]